MASKTRVQSRVDDGAWLTALIVAITVGMVTVIAAQPSGWSRQERYKTGQTIAPAYEGWEQNADGSFNLVFGYFNRNWEEQTYVPVGPNNTIEPGGPDQGQPTRFFPRRNKFIFKVTVPKDFGNKELVWTLTTRAHTEKAYATLKPDYKLDPRIYQTNMHMLLGVPNYPTFEKDLVENIPPVVRLEGAAQRTVAAGAPLSLNASVADDGRYRAKPAPAGFESDTTALGLRVVWFVYRGDGDVMFEPAQFTHYQDKRPGGNSPWSPKWTPPPLPADGKHPVTVRFVSPGNYVVRVLAHDGGLQAFADVGVTVTGNPTTSAAVR